MTERFLQGITLIITQRYVTILEQVTFPFIHESTWQLFRSTLVDPGVSLQTSGLALGEPRSVAGSSTVLD